MSLSAAPCHVRSEDGHGWFGLAIKAAAVYESAQMLVAIFRRRLKEGATFEDFIAAWEADMGMAGSHQLPLACEASLDSS